MIRFAAMEIIFVVFALLTVYFITKYARKPIKRAVDDVKYEYNRPDEDDNDTSEGGVNQ